MRVPAFIVTAALLVSSGCTDASGPVEPAAVLPSASDELAASRAHRIAVAGDFAANVDFSSLTLTPKGANCLLRVRGQLVFTGTIVGTTTGQTSALVFAPCSEVATNPPGTFRDVFKSPFRFEGTVDGMPVSASGIYMGSVEPGGSIDGQILFVRGIRGALRAEAQVAVGGSYRGAVVVR